MDDGLWTLFIKKEDFKDRIENKQKNWLKKKNS